MSSILAKYRNMDMLHGSLWDKIVVFSLPLALTSILQQLFNAADVAVLGNYVGEDAVAAVGNNIPIIGLVVNLFVGISLGANVVVARYLGMRDEGNANQSVHTAFFLALVMGIVIACIGVPLTDYFVGLLKVPDSVFEGASTYLRIYFMGMPFMAIYNFEAALLRSKGDTNTPLLALAIASVFNIVGNILAVKYFDAGIAGVALATSMSNALCALILFIKLRLEKGFLHVNITEILRPSFRKSKAIVSIGLPAGIQGMVFALSNLLIQSAINSLGTDVMAASAAAFTIEINVYCFINAFGLAATTFVSQNYGANNIERCKKVVRVSFLLDLIVSMICGAFILIYCRELISLFSENEKVIELGILRVFIVVLPEFLSVIMEILSGTMRGCGYSLPPALATLIGICSVRVIWLYTVFEAYPTYGSLMAVYGVSWAITALFICYLYFNFRKKYFVTKI